MISCRRNAVPSLSIAGHCRRTAWREWCSQMSMKIACLGGGPAGLYFAISMKLRNASHDITVIERNRADDTFGWVVVLSDETLANLKIESITLGKSIM